MTEYEDSNVTERKIDRYESAYRKHEGEKGDRPKSSSPSESKFITDILQKEQTGTWLKSNIFFPIVMHEK